MAMIDASVPVLAITSPGRGGQAMRPVLDRLEQAGARVLRVGPAQGLWVDSDGIAEELLPVLEILPLQKLAWHLAIGRGADPDHPRGLAKVTHTW
jgi:glucosamine--fructose-6-phosphate aminotransferase (isomerizing)